MSYGRDRNARTRGVGAIAAIDHVSGKRRRMAAMGAVEMAKRDRELTLLARTAFRPMAMGKMIEGEIPGRAEPRPRTPPSKGPPINPGPLPPPYQPPSSPPYVPPAPSGLPGKAGGLTNPGSGGVYTTPPVWTQNTPPSTTGLPPPGPLPDPMPPAGGGTTGTNSGGGGGGGSGGGGGGGKPFPENGGIVPPGFELPPQQELPPINDGMSNTTKYVLLGVAVLGGYFLWKEHKGA